MWPFDTGDGDNRPCKLDHWSYGDIPVNVILAYDMLAPGDALERMAPLIRPESRQRFESDLIRFSYQSVRAWPDTYDNMMPSVYRSMIVAGRVAGQSDMVHHAVEGARTLMDINFSHDGWWREGTPSYHWQVVSWMDRVTKAA